MSIAALEAGLYAKLISITTAGSVHALCGGRIYAGWGHEDGTLPMLAFTIIAHDSGRVKFNRDDIIADVQIDVWADKTLGQTAALTISDKLKTDFHKASPTITGYGGTQMDCTNPGTITTEDRAIRVMTEWRITATKS